MRRSGARRWLPGLFTASLTACTSHSVSDAPSGPSPYVAEWVRDQIAAFEQAAVGTANRVDGKVVFEGVPLYLIRSPCCDLYNYLYTADGKTFCAPSGGFTGGGDRKCPPGIGPVQRRIEN